jgi:polysaccharide export outer membrane protein
VQDLPAASMPAEEAIHPRDTIVVAVRNQPSMSGELVVRDDGGVMVPTIGDVAVAGRPPSAVAAELRARLNNIVVNPEVAVSVSKVAPIRVSVIGELKAPGSYELARDHGVAAALAAAGWLGDFASRDRIFVVRRGPNDSRVRFRVHDVTNPARSISGFRLRDGDVVVVE